MSSDKDKCKIEAVEKIAPDWRVFKHHSEAGRLLRRLYGVSVEDKPPITYPPLVRKNRSDTNSTQVAHKSPWQIGNKSNSGIVTCKTKQSVSVPKVGIGKEPRNRKSIACIDEHRKKQNVDSIPHRKTEIACRDDWNKCDQIRKEYRPPNPKVCYAGDEKDRLNTVFASKGGRGLPDELTRSKIESKGNSGEAEVTCRKMTSIVDEIKYEINERATYLNEIDETGLSISTKERTKIHSEIEDRIRELERFNIST